MPAFGGRKKRAEEPRISPYGIYTCSQCGRALELEKVLRADAEREEGAATGFVLFDHYCPCDVSAVHTSRLWGSYPSFVALFGTQPALPYAAPFTWQPVKEDDPMLSRWRWELGQVADVGEFMLFLDDAAEGRAA